MISCLFAAARFEQSGHEKRVDVPLDVFDAPRPRSVHEAIADIDLVATLTRWTAPDPALA